jgi:hypothetical protein
VAIKKLFQQELSPMALSDFANEIEIMTYVLEKWRKVGSWSSPKGERREGMREGREGKGKERKGEEGRGRGRREGEERWTTNFLKILEKFTTPM